MNPTSSDAADTGDDVPEIAGDPVMAATTAVQILGGADQSTAALRRKLLARGHPAGVVDRVVADMVERRLVNDRALAEAIVARRLRECYGRNRIVADLRRREITSDVISEVVATIDADSEAVAAESIARRRVGRRTSDRATNRATDRGTRAKLGAFLERRGFTAATIARTLRSVEDGSPDDPSTSTGPTACVPSFEHRR